MKSKLSIFIVIFAITLFSLVKVNAVVTAPPTRTIPFPYTNPDEPGSPSITPQPTNPPVNITDPGEPSQIEPTEPVKPPIRTNPVNPPTNPTPTNLNNYDIFGNNQPRFDFRFLVLVCCLCILGLVCLSAGVFVIIHNRKKKKLDASPLL